jgi:hypothetical protein
MHSLKSEKVGKHTLFFQKGAFKSNSKQIEVAMWQDKPNCGECLIGYFNSKEEGIAWFKKYGEQPERNVSAKPAPSIGTVAGEAFFVRTEVENADGRWNDSYATRDGYWVIHDGKYHHVYKVR